MCGITGFITGNGCHSDYWKYLRRSTDSLIHRGPDDSGIWYDQKVGIGLGHRRLSILDLSSAGHQPMLSHSGRYVIVFNGEIYNFEAVRRELEDLEPVSWRGGSDTEVILAAVEKWGIETAVKRFIGMFAFAIWDRSDHSLALVRDRIGEKPLYYGWNGGSFYFASELKAFKAYPGFNMEVNRDALTLYLRHNCIPAPYTIYKGIHKLIPGTILKIIPEARQSDPVAYWSARAVAEEGLKNPFEGTDQDAVEALEALLRDAVGKQMIAEVPLGLFLSGGIDSSTIAALMQVQSSRSVKTFTIGFSEEDYNEALYARAVAKHLGTDHIELYVSPSDALDVIPRLPELYDEPFADASQIPTFLISKLTRRYVTVGLSGDAGDELFCGYNRYFWWKRIWEGMRFLPQPIRKFTYIAINRLSPSKWDTIFDGTSRLLPKSFKQRSPGEKLHKLAAIFDANDPMEMYLRFVSHWQSPSNLILGATEPFTCITDRSCWMQTSDETLQMMYLDLISYLPDDILTKVDRAAMGVSLETRVPFLDHRVVEFAQRIPFSMKIRNGQGKWILRQVLQKHVPKQLIERPKAGFGVPIVSWLRGPLREWAETLIDERRLLEEGFFDPAPIRKMWSEHLAGNRNWQYHLWDILMFQAWLENQ